MKMIYRFSVTILTILVCLIGCSDKQPRQLYEKAGSFSYDPPSGWRIVEFPGLKYKISYGQTENGFSPNINVVDEMFSGTLTEYVDGNLKNMEKLFSKFNIISQEKIKTKDNEEAEKIIIENEQNGSMLRQSFLFIGSGNKKYVVTCSALADGGAKFDTEFLKSLKTFRIH